MSSQPDPVTGMPLASPGSQPGDPGWQRALAEKARLLAGMQGAR
jgi:hypothetical protein